MKSQREETIDIKRRLLCGIKASKRGLSLGEFLSMTHRDLVGLSSWPFSGSTSSKVPSSSVRGSITATASIGSIKTSAGRLRGWNEGLRCHKGKSLGGERSCFKSPFSQKVLTPTSPNHLLPVQKNHLDSVSRTCGLRTALFQT